jgi:hypothetical protein
LGVCVTERAAVLTERCPDRVDDVCLLHTLCVLDPDA